VARRGRACTGVAEPRQPPMQKGPRKYFIATDGRQTLCRRESAPTRLGSGCTDESFQAYRDPKDDQSHAKKISAIAAEKGERICTQAPKHRPPFLFCDTRIRVQRREVLRRDFLDFLLGAFFLVLAFAPTKFEIAYSISRIALLNADCALANVLFFLEAMFLSPKLQFQHM
jgi:hypothetical protein